MVLEDADPWRSWTPGRVQGTRAGGAPPHYVTLPDLAGMAAIGPLFERVR